MQDNFVEIKNLFFKRQSRIVFGNATLSIPRGKITAIMGPSGCGKTTLLKLIGAQLRPISGEILVDGINIHKLTRRELYKMRHKMGLLFQSGALFTNINVFENVAFPLREHTQLPEEMINDVVLIQLETVGLRGARDLMPNELSGGMARRVALARALALNPKLMMYDEPFTGQDPITMGVLLKLIKELNDILGLTSIVVSHDVVETAGIADYIYIISDEGEIIGEGTAQKILSDKTPFVDQFMHGLHDGPVHFHYPAPNYQEDLEL